jgi:hypothetical protein
MAQTSRDPRDYNSSVLEKLIARLATDRHGNISANQLGKWLRKIGGRVVKVGDRGDYRLEKAPAVYAGRARFKVMKVA